MKRELSERTRMFTSGIAGVVVTSLLMFTVVEALSPQNLLRRDAPAVIASSGVASDSSGA